jgi:FtsH-binding integral membrane protein
MYGFVTKRDLTGIGSFLVMGAIGLFIASLVNVFIASNALSWVITYAVLGVFIGITAYETQRLRNMAEQHAGNADLSGRLAIVGALVLYIAFINIFLSILRILGSRR